MRGARRSPQCCQPSRPNERGERQQQQQSRAPAPTVPSAVRSPPSAGNVASRSEKNRGKTLKFHFSSVSWNEIENRAVLIDLSIFPKCSNRLENNRFRKQGIDCNRKIEIDVSNPNPYHRSFRQRQPPSQHLFSFTCSIEIIMVFIKTKQKQKREQNSLRMKKHHDATRRALKAWRWCPTSNERWTPHYWHPTLRQKNVVQGLPNSPVAAQLEKEERTDGYRASGHGSTFGHDVETTSWFGAHNHRRRLQQHRPERHQAGPHFVCCELQSCHW